VRSVTAKTPRGVLFDSGDTLIQPIGGRWNPRFDFEDVVRRHHADIPAAAFPPAFAAGQRLLDSSSVTVDRDDYHRRILELLGVPEPSRALLDELDCHLERPAVECFPEVRGVLTTLRAQGVRMAVVSDSWPSLEHLFEQLELRQFFDAFVVSAVIGCKKPDARMYLTASDGLDLFPDECLFVDDNPAFVAAAIDLGFDGLALVRDAAAQAPDMPCITTLDEVLARFDEARTGGSGPL
jgi:putative hydrolase of the HAD superfamily